MGLFCTKKRNSQWSSFGAYFPEFRKRAVNSHARPFCRITQLHVALKDKSLAERKLGLGSVADRADHSNPRDGCGDDGPRGAGDQGPAGDPEPWFPAGDPDSNWR